MVTALAKLHNFCIDGADGVVAPPLLQDENNVATNEHGSVSLVPNAEVDEVLGIAANTPEGLIGGAHHNEDIGRYFRRRQQEDVVRTRLHIHLENTHMVRPSRRR